MIENLTNDARDFLYHNLDAEQHIEDEVKTLINFVFTVQASVLILLLVCSATAM